MNPAPGELQRAAVRLRIGASASVTLASKSRRANGLGKNVTPLRRTPWRAIPSSTYPDM